MIGVDINAIIAVRWLAFVGAVIVPCILMAGIVLRTAQRFSAYPREYSGHAEPIVFVVLGSLFIILNNHYFQKFGEAMLTRAGKDLTSGSARTQFYLCFSIAAIAIMMTLAKSFWTHILLEDNEWGPLTNYRNALQRSGKGWLRVARVVLDLALRCVIAALVILMQHQFANIHYVNHIDKVVMVTEFGEGEFEEFAKAFNEWLAGYATLGWSLYISILIWVAVCAPSQDQPGRKAAVIGTLTSMAPAFIVMWWMYCIVRGFGVPFVWSAGDMEAGPVLMSAYLTGALSVLIIGNVFYTVWSQQRGYFCWTMSVVWGWLTHKKYARRGAAREYDG